MTQNWIWTCQDSAGNRLAVDELDIPFPTQADAEAWLGQSWMDLVEVGAESVTLHCDADLIYGPMSLRAAQE